MSNHITGYCQPHLIGGEGAGGGRYLSIGDFLSREWSHFEMADEV
jgi:hypothetical protein